MVYAYGLRLREKSYLPGICRRITIMVKSTTPPTPAASGSAPSATAVAGVTVQIEHLSDVIEEFAPWISRRGGHIIPAWWSPGIVNNKRRANFPENRVNIALSRQNGL
jgi:hypothetical protein